ncbi:MAG: RNA polymerase sigma factor [Deltaproteobacteria bacterium]|nr:RNA polymerase sigma factor [Deltaproteobacteria bacterium]
MDGDQARAPDDEELMRRFARGDVRAFEALVARHQKGVFNFCLRTLRDRSSAEDATQEIFLRVVKTAKTWERNAKLTTWLYTIARNHCIDAMRRASYRKTASLDQSLGDSEDGATLRDRLPDEREIPADRGADSSRARGLLLKAIAELPDEQREVFLMRETAGMPFKEIADVVGAPENTVKSRMRYALEHLRSRLVAAGIEPPEAA